MKALLLLLILSLSSICGVVAVLTSSPRKMIFSWLVIGMFQSLFFLVIGFELIAILNMIFVLGSATVIKLFSSLYGSEDARRIESNTNIRNWIYGLGQTLTLGAVLVFSFSDATLVDRFREDLETHVFTNRLIEKFPEMPWILGFILFLTVVVGSTVARPVWKKVTEESK